MKMSISKKRLTSKEISDAKEQLMQINDSLVEEMNEIEAERYRVWLNKIVVLNPVAILRPDHVVSIRDDLFDADPTLGFHVLELTMRFFTQSGDRDDFIECLANNLCDGLHLDGPYPSYSTLPTAWLTSMPMTTFKRGSWANWLRVLCRWMNIEVINTQEFLLSNKYLMVILLMRMCYTSA